MKRLRIEIGPERAGQRVDQVLAGEGGLGEARARLLLKEGAVSIDGLRVKSASRLLRMGERVEASVADEAPAAPQPRLAAERVLFEDAHLVAVDKPAGVQAHASSKDAPRDDLLALVSERLGREAGLVHRLDLETTGVTVFGKTAEATTALAAAFEEGTARKRYLALAVGTLPDEGRVELPIGPDPRRWGKFRTRGSGGLEAATRFHVLARRGPACAVEVFPETGRTHQIRVHLKELGAPLAGDALYGGPEQVETERGPLRAQRVMLHARSLSLPHPKTAEPLTIQAPVPADLEEMLVGVGAAPEDL